MLWDKGILLSIMCLWSTAVFGQEWQRLIIFKIEHVAIRSYSGSSYRAACLSSELCTNFSKHLDQGLAQSRHSIIIWWANNGTCKGLSPVCLFPFSAKKGEADCGWSTQNFECLTSIIWHTAQLVNKHGALHARKIWYWIKAKEI